MAVNNQLTQKKQSFSQFMTSEATKKSIMQTLEKEDVQRFITATVSLVTNNEALSQCQPSSVVLASLQGAALKLSPAPQLGQFYLVPFNDKKKGKVAQFQLGYKGYVALAIRSGQYLDIDVKEVRDGEYLGLDKRTGKPKFEWVEDDTDRLKRPIIGYWAYFELLNGFTKIMYWSKEKMEAHALEYSQGYAADKRKKTRYTFWSKDFDGMAYKTMLRQLISKWGIMSIDMQDALTKDEATINKDGSYDYVDTNQSDIEDQPIDVESKEVPEEAPTPQQQDDRLPPEAPSNVQDEFFIKK